MTPQTTDASSRAGRGIRRLSVRVALLHRERTLDAREVLLHEAAERRSGIAVGLEPRARRVAQLGVRQGRGVQTDDEVLRDLVRARLPDGQQHVEVRLDEGAELLDARGVREARRGGTDDRVGKVVAVDERRPGGTLGRLVGECRLGLRGELAALGRVVGGEGLVDLSLGDDAARRERDEQLPRQVGVDVEPGERDLAAALANAVTSCSWLSLPVSAACASSQRASATFARAAARFSGATYALAASCSCARVVRTVVDSVSEPMLRSTRS